MKQLSLGNTSVSALCLGGVWFGSKEDKATSFRLLDQYADAGGRFIDTANMYAHWFSEETSGGESETVIGEWLKQHGNRDEFVIATKLGFPYPGVEQGLRAGQIIAECDKSLARLQTDVIDLYYAHVDDTNTPYEETMEAFDRLVQAGKVRQIGASNYAAWRLAEVNMVSAQNGWASYVALQQRHTYLRPKPNGDFGSQLVLDEPTIDCCAAHDVRILAYSPTINGAYADRVDRPIPEQYDTPDTTARLSALKEVAAQVGASPLQVVLAWMLHGSPAILPIIGGSTAAQLAENLGALEVNLSDGQMMRLNEAGA